MLTWHNFHWHFVFYIYIYRDNYIFCPPTLMLSLFLQFRKTLVCLLGLLGTADWSTQWMWFSGHTLPRLISWHRWPWRDVSILRCLDGTHISCQDCVCVYVFMWQASLLLSSAIYHSPGGQTLCLDRGIGDIGHTHGIFFQILIFEWWVSTGLVCSTCSDVFICLGVTSCLCHFLFFCVIFTSL